MQDHYNDYIAKLSLLTAGVLAGIMLVSHTKPPFVGLGTQHYNYTVLTIFKWST